MLRGDSLCNCTQMRRMFCANPLARFFVSADGKLLQVCQKREGSNRILLETIIRAERMDLVIALTINGLVWGLIVALIALGLSIIFGLLDIINVAHGDFFMVGTVLAWATLQLTGSFWLAFLVAPLIGFILGALIQRTVIQPIHNVAALSI